MTNNYTNILDPSVGALEQLIQIKDMQIDSLLEVTKAINDNKSAKELFRIYEFILMVQIKAKRLVGFHKDEDWRCVCRYGIAQSAIQKIDVTEQLNPFDKVTSLSEYNGALSPFELVIPVYHKAEALAFILIGGVEESLKSSLNEKVNFIQTITNIIVVAIENKRLFKQQLDQESFKKELEVAEQVQTMLIPKILPHNELIEMDAVYKPHYSISGDYYDYIPLDDSGNEFLVCMADVSGKGIAAALLMANFQAVLRALAKETKDLVVLIEKLNARLMEITKGDKFITFFIGKHNLANRSLHYINAGHNSPVLYADGEIHLLDKGATILGAFDELPFIELGQINIVPNTFVIAYTDGLTDVENEAGTYFEMDRLQDFVKEKAALPIQQFHKELLERIQVFKGEQIYTDDISILSYRIF